MKYYVRKTWEDTETQMGEYKSLNSAKKAADANPDYRVFSDEGDEVYTPITETLGFKVTVAIPDLNIRKGPGIDFDRTGKFTGKGTFTVTEEKNGYGRLDTGEGWISLKYCKRV